MKKMAIRITAISLGIALLLTPGLVFSNTADERYEQAKKLLLESSACAVFYGVGHAHYLSLAKAGQPSNEVKIYSDAKDSFALYVNILSKETNVNKKVLDKYMDDVRLQVSEEFSSDFRVARAERCAEIARETKSYIMKMSDEEKRDIQRMKKLPASEEDASEENL